MSNSKAGNVSIMLVIGVGLGTLIDATSRADTPALQRVEDIDLSIVVIGGDTLESFQPSWASHVLSPATIQSGSTSCCYSPFEVATINSVGDVLFSADIVGMHDSLGASMSGSLLEVLRGLNDHSLLRLDPTGHVITGDVDDNPTVGTSWRPGIKRLLGRGGVATQAQEVIVGPYVVNKNGDVLYSIDYIPAAGGARRAALIVNHDGVDELVAEDGQQAGGFPAGIVFDWRPATPGDSWAANYVLGDNGEVMFQARVAGPGITNSNSIGLWYGKPGKLRIVTRTSNSAAGITDRGVYSGFGQFRIGPEGKVAFFATLTGDRTKSPAVAYGVWEWANDQVRLVTTDLDSFAPFDGSLFTAFRGLDYRFDAAGRLIGRAEQYIGPLEKFDLKPIFGVDQPARGTSGTHQRANLVWLVDNFGETALLEQSEYLEKDETLDDHYGTGLWFGTAADLRLIVRDGSEVNFPDGTRRRVSNGNGAIEVSEVLNNRALISLAFDPIVGVADRSYGLFIAHLPKLAQPPRTPPPPPPPPVNPPQATPTPCGTMGFALFGIATLCLVCGRRQLAHRAAECRSRL